MLRLKGFSEPYKEYRLSDLFEKSSLKNKDGSISNVLTNSAQYGLISQKDFFDKDIANKENTDGYYVVQPGDFVYNPRKSATAPFGPFNCYKGDEPGLVSPLYTVLHPKTAFNIDYLMYLFASPCWHKYVYMNGDKGARFDRVSIKTETFMDMPIHLPPDEEQIEQVEIADCFSSVDDVIADYEAQVENMLNQKKGVMQKLFSQEVRFKKDDGGEYPDWENVSLKALCTEISDGNWIESKDQSEEGIRLIQTGNIGVCCFDNKTGKEKWISEETFLRLKCKEIFAGDIIASRLPSPAGRACILPNINQRMITAVDCTIIRTNDECEKEYLVQFMSSIEYFKQVEAFLAGGTRQRISRSNLETIRVPKPHPDEQKKIAECLSAFDEAIDDLHKTVEHWKNIKKGLLQQLFV